MTEEERTHSKTLVYQVLPSRYGLNPDDLRRADAIEIVVGQARSRAGVGCSSATRSPTASRPCATCEGDRPAQRLPASDWTGPDDLEIKIHELREITDWEKPIS